MVMASIEQVPQFGALSLGVPLPEVVAVGEEPLLGASLFLVSSTAADPVLLVEPGRAERLVAFGEALSGLFERRVRDLSGEDRVAVMRLVERVTDADDAEDERRAAAEREELRAEIAALRAQVELLVERSTPRT